MTSSSTSISGVATTSRRRVFLVVFLALVALVVIRYRPQGFLPFLSWCCAVGAFLCTCMSAFLSADRDETYRRAPSEPGSSFLGVVGLLLGVTASVGVAVLLVLRGISVSLTWVHGVPGGDIPALGFEAQGLWTRQRWIKENWNKYEMFAHGPNHGNITRYSIGSQVFTRDAVLYHCPWPDRSKPWEQYEDPEITLRKHLDRGLDLIVGAFNSRRSLEPVGNFDFLISNPKSSEKHFMLDSW